MHLLPLLLLVGACSEPADSSATDGAGDSATTVDSDTAPGVTLPLGEVCDPAVSACGEGAACCTACCEAGNEPVCTALDALGGCPLPDLSIDAERMAGSLDIQDVPFEADDCAIAEGCVDAPGSRRLLRFATTTPNSGTADLRMGRPDENDPLFDYSECHAHFHFTGYANYELLGADGVAVANGHKQAFCLMDYENWEDGGRARYSCEFQGISTGWADTYDAYLDCQWVDITDVPAGDYTLRVTLNADHAIPELSYDNNVMEVPVAVLNPEDEPPVTEPCVTTGYGEYRNCGWEEAGTFNCVPGESLTLGCADACEGRCSTDTLMRVCEGESTACRGEDALVNNDDGCGGSCSMATLACPESGVVTALVSAWASVDSATCTIAAL